MSCPRLDQSKGPFQPTRRKKIGLEKNAFSKGQLISKCPYEKSVSSKIPTKKISEIFALASKERSKQKKIKALYYTN